MTRIKQVLVASVLALSPLTGGCGADDPAGAGVVGTWDGPGRATVTLDADGSAEGNDGCNDLAARWEPLGDTTGTFMVTESNEVGCPDVTGWGEATAYAVEGDRLVIEAGDGEDLTELTRAE